MLEEVLKTLKKATTLDEGKAFIFAINAEMKRLIIDLNTKGQLGRDGIDSDGASLGEYADFTVQSRSGLGLQTGHIDFKVTGNYWASWGVTVKKDFIEITSDQSRFNELVNDLNFSDKHVGLTEESLEVLRKRVAVRYYMYLRKQLL